MTTTSKRLRPLFGLLVGPWVLGLGQAWARQESQAPRSVEVRLQRAQSLEEPRRTEPRARQLRVVIDTRVDQIAWRARLTDADIDARELAFDELVARARWDAQLGLALESWALDPAMPELAWTARMALRELRQAPAGLQGGWVEQTDEGGASGVDSKAALLRAIDVEKILSLPELVQPLSPRKSLSMYEPRAFQLPRRPRRQVFKLDVQPEGVVLTEYVYEDNQVRQQRYAAESSQALLEAYPSLRNRVPGLTGILAKPFGPGSQFQWDRDRQLLRFGSSDPGYATEVSARSGLQDGLPSGPRIAFLGVKVTPATDDSTAATLLGPGVGLVIERREPGSVAEDLGLQRGDILIEMAGEPLCSPEEISRLLQECGQQQELVLKFLDRSGLERRVTWSPKAPR